MICGKQVTDDKDVMVTTMKKLERLLAQTQSSEGHELDFYPWLRFFGHPTYKKIQARRCYGIDLYIFETRLQIALNKQTNGSHAKCNVVL